MGKKMSQITEIIGQDGSRLAELLVRRSRDAYGIKRRTSAFNTDRIGCLFRDPRRSVP
jgi:GDPmannose 4,6-dehydratase